MNLRDARTQARQLLDAGDYDEAGKLYHQLWDELGDAFSGSRYIHCLRKAGHPDYAVKVAEQLLEKHPDDAHVKRELVWALYEAKFKLASEHANLHQMARVGQEILNLTDEILPRRLVAFAIIGLAKDKRQWSVVSYWCDQVDLQALDAAPREMGGRRIISEREQWYFAKVKSLIQLKQWEEARRIGLEAVQAFPHKLDFARWSAQAAANLGQVDTAITELENLVQRGRPGWYVLHELAQLKYQVGDASIAYQLACQAALAPGEDKAKVGLYLTIGQIALAQSQPEIAVRHCALARLIREREDWSIPKELAQLEARAQEQLSQLKDWAELRPLFKMCRQDWETVVPPEVRPKTKSKHSRKSQLKTDNQWHTGHIKVYKEDRGFGFITPDEGKQDLFFHISKVEGLETPQPGTAVCFQIIDTEKGLNAIKVKPANR